MGQFVGAPDRIQVMGSTSFTSQLWVLGSQGDPCLGLSTRCPSPQRGFLPERTGAKQQPPPQSGEPTSVFCTRSLLWVPSQYGGFWVALQVQRATMRVS